MKKQKKVLAVLLALIMVFSLAACGNNNSNDGEAIFNVATSGGYDTMNFFTTESSLVYDWLNILYDSLIAYDDEYNAIPRAAKDWTVSDDGKTWKKIYEQKEGNGKLENITLEQPVTTRYFRLLGKKRGTQWGYSLWEIQLFAE